MSFSDARLTRFSIALRENNRVLTGQSSIKLSRSGNNVLNTSEKTSAFTMLKILFSEGRSGVGTSPKRLAHSFWGKRAAHSEATTTVRSA